jgi:hypothetical protein
MITTAQAVQNPAYRPAHFYPFNLVHMTASSWKPFSLHLSLGPSILGSSLRSFLYPIECLEKLSQMHPLHLKHET